MNAFARTFGPFTGGNIIAWSFNNDLPFPLNRFFLFEILTLIMISMQGILWYSNRGKKGIENKNEKDEEKEELKHVEISNFETVERLE